MPAAKIREEQILNFNADVITAPLTGFSSGSGTLSTTDTILQGFNKLDGNDGLKALKTTTVAGFALSSNVVLANHTVTTGLSGGSYNGSSAVAWSIDETFTPTWTGLHIHQINAIATGSTDGIYLQNTTASTAIATVQNGPQLHLSGTAWATGAAASQTGDFKFKLIPVTGATIGVQLHIQYQVNGGGYNDALIIDNFGSFIAANTFFQQKSSIATTSTDAFVYQNLTSATAGVPLQYSTRARFQGAVWNTTATAATNQVDFINEVRPVSGTTPRASMFWSSRISVAGSGAFTDVMSIDNSGNLDINGYKTTLATQNTGATLSVAQMQSGVVCTSTAAVAYTTATATAIATQMGFTGNGFWYDWIVDNSASTSVGIITITLGTGLTAMTAITGENTLTVQIGIVAIYRFIFTSATVAKVGRIV